MKKQNLKAFTLVELLVVISIIALLVSILMPALSRAREQARRVICATNLHTIGQAFYIYAMQNNDWLPLHRDNFQLHDLSYKTSNFVLDNGGHKDTFYCPSNKVARSDDPRFWQYAQLVILGGSLTHLNEEPPDGPTSIDNFSLHDQLYRVTSYHWLMDMYNPRVDPPYRALSTSMQRNDKIWPKRISERSASEVEVVVDQIVSDGPTVGDNFKDLTHSYLFLLWGIKDDTNHVRRGSEPEGGEVLFLDDHVEWRDINQMKPYWGTVPYHWW